MGGRGSSSRIGGKNFDAPLNESKVGSTYKSLPKSFQENIKNNLQISPEMKRDIENGRRNKMTDEWSTGLTGSKTKMKVITDVLSNGTVTYTAKIRNKVIPPFLGATRTVTSGALTANLGGASLP